MSGKYSFGKTVSTSFDETVARATEALAKEGFGVLTEIDVAATLKKKLGRDMPPYRILGACNPQFAHRAIELEPQIGALLPCNVVVRVDATGKTIVEIMDPDAVLQLFVASVLWAYTGSRDRNSATLRQMSTIDHATRDFPPTFISGGNSDPFTDAHSRPFATRLSRPCVGSWASSRGTGCGGGARSPHGARARGDASRRGA